MERSSIPVGFFKEKFARSKKTQIKISQNRSPQKLPLKKKGKSGLNHPNERENYENKPAQSACSK